MDKDAYPFITAVMPARNEERFISSTLDELLGQDYPPDRFEIIVADGGSTDSTREIVSRVSLAHPQVILRDNPGRLPSSGRNVGFRHGRGDIFIVVDGHCRIGNPRLFKDVVSSFMKSGADCLCRPQPLDPPGLTAFQQAVCLARNSPVGHSGGSYIYSDFEGYVSPVSHGAIYSRRVFDKIGYVDESFDACEDVEFNYRVEKAGFKSYMSPLLKVRYYPRETLYGLLRQMMRYGRGRFRFIAKHPEALGIETLLPPVFVAAFLLLPVLGLAAFFSNMAFLKLSLAFLLAGFGLYGLIIAVESTRISAKNGFRYFRRLIPVFFAVHFGLGLGFIAGVLRSLGNTAYPLASHGNAVDGEVGWKD